MNNKITRKEFLMLVGGGMLSITPLGRRLLSILDDPPVLTTIDVSPAYVTIRVNEQRTFTATGKDQYGNPYPISNPVWIVSGGGPLMPNGTTATFIAFYTGDFTITCKQDGTTIQGSSTIHIVPADSQLTTIELSPAYVTIRVNEQRTFTATGKDQYGNPYPISNPVWETSGGGTLAPNGATCTYTATSTGDYTITCRQSGTDIQGTANIFTGYRIYLPQVSK